MPRAGRKVILASAAGTVFRWHDFYPYGALAATIGARWLPDRVGRKPIILAGFALAALAYLPLFQAMGAVGNPALHQAQRSIPVVLMADPAGCGGLLDPATTGRPTRPCDVARAALTGASVAFRMAAAPTGAGAAVRIAGRSRPRWSSFSRRASATPASPCPIMSAMAASAGCCPRPASP